MDERGTPPAWKSRVTGPARVLPGPPWLTAWPPARYCAPVGLVLPSELTTQRRLLVEVNKRYDCSEEHPRVREQDQLAQNERLTNDDRSDRDVHGISHVSVEPTDDETLSGRHGRGRAEALDDKALESMD